MKWFSGGVAAAVASCRQENALFIVFAHDDSTESKATDEAWSSQEVSELMSSRKYVALKVAKNSLEYIQFSQLYAVFLVPSIFCIGRTGHNLLAMNGPQTAAQLHEKLNQAFVEFDAEMQSNTETAPLHPVVVSQSVNSTSTSAIESGNVSGMSSKKEKTKEDALKRYQERIKEQRQDRVKDEFEKEHRREIQRRELGKNVARLKEEQEERQTQSWLKERQKQKEEAKLAREMIKAKLEQDKLERQAQQRNAVTDSHQQAQDSAYQALTSTSISSECRIQLKLPAGSSKVVKMKNSDTLKTLRERAALEINRSVDSVLLCSSYPRSELSHDMDSHTMLQLQLVPSGVVIVREKKGTYTSPNSSKGGGIVGFLMNLVHLLMYCLNLIKNTVMELFSGGKKQDSVQDKLCPPPRYQDQRKGGRNINSGNADLRVRKFRQEDYRDDSEEDGTYNGNSTQQQ